MGLHANAIDRVDVPEKRERVRVAAKEDVLAVIDPLAGLPIGERGCAATQAASRLEHEHTRAQARQPRARAQPGKAAADDGDVVAGYEGSSHCFSAIAACSGRPSRTRRENTS